MRLDTQLAYKDYVKKVQKLEKDWAKLVRDAKLVPNALVKIGRHEWRINSVFTSLATGGSITIYANRRLPSRFFGKAERVRSNVTEFEFIKMLKPGALS